MNRFGPIGLVVVQSTSLCNLDCSYCYLPDRQKKRVFDLDMLPLLMPVSYTHLTLPTTD